MVRWAGVHEVFVAGLRCFESAGDVLNLEVELRGWRARTGVVCGAPAA
jgi:hypothetical protein